MESGETRFPQRFCERTDRTTPYALCLAIALASSFALGCGDDDANVDGGVAPGDGDGDGDGNGDGDGDGDPDAGDAGDAGDARDATVDEDDDGGGPAPVACASSAACDDGIVCNGVEQCTDGFCAPGAPMACPPEHPCREDLKDCDCTIPDVDEDLQAAEVCGGPDCNDNDVLINEDGIEICDENGVDEDCDAATFHREGADADGDKDGDGYIDEQCFNIDRATRERYEGNDCRDNNPRIHPTNSEVCDYEDNDCNGTVDEAPGPNGEETNVEGGLREPFYPDLDGDGCGALGVEPRMECAHLGPPGYISGQEPCDCSDDLELDDKAAQVNQRAREVCDGVDNDCDELIDQEDDSQLKEHDFTGTTIECVDGAWDILKCPDGLLWCTDIVDRGCTTDGTQLTSCGACVTDCKFGCGGDLGCDEVTGLAVGDKHACASTQQGRAGCWGRGVDGRLGTDSVQNEFEPTAVVGIEDISSVVASAAFSCAIAGSSDELYCWGSNDVGQLGNSDAGASSVVPLGVASPFEELVLSDVRSVALAEQFGCAALMSGELLCWGRDGNGRLANGETATGFEQLPQIAYDVDYADVVNAASVAVGDQHGCIVTVEGTLSCWGDNTRGQLGTRDIPEMTDVVRVIPELSNITMVTAGLAHTCALSSGEVLCWGLNNRLQLGRTSDGNDDLPATVLGLPEIVAIAAGTLSTCALDVDGAVHCWGSNERGERGDANPEDAATPVTVGLAVPAVTLATGGSNACALGNDGQAYCWGGNDLGQLGVGRSYQAAQPDPLAIEPLDTRSN
jgi:hypothetical protein